VYERVSGKTIPVTDPTRLASLFARGETARGQATSAAAHAARDVVRLAKSSAGVQFGLSLAAASYAPDVGSRLFTTGFDSGMQSSISTLLSDDDPTSAAGAGVREVTQEALSFRVAATHELGDAWIVRASRDGAVAIHWALAVRRADVMTVMERVKRAWASADELVGALGAVGPRNLHLIAVGEAFPTDANRRPVLPRVIRDGLANGTNESVLASISRELLRATGVIAYEDRGDTTGAL
jgi:hypothetical protein